MRQSLWSASVASGLPRDNGGLSPTTPPPINTLHAARFTGDPEHMDMNSGFCPSSKKKIML